MDRLIALDQDWHTHSTFTDGADTPQAMLSAAERAGLASWGLSDHVRTDSSWLDGYVRTVRSLRSDRLDIKCGVETKIRTTDGDLDLPAELPELDYVLIAGQLLPDLGGPIGPNEVADDLRAGKRTVQDVIGALLAGTVAAAKRSPFPPIVVHLFSLLGRCGLSDDDVPEPALAGFARELADLDVAVEINEKWRRPSARVVHVLAAAGVPLVAGSDAHRAADVGRWDYTLNVGT